MITEHVGLPRVKSMDEIGESFSNVCVPSNKFHVFVVKVVHM